MRLVQGDTFGTCMIKYFMISTHTARVCAYRHNLYRVNVVDRIIVMYEGWNFNSGNYLFTTDTK